MEEDNLSGWEGEQRQMRKLEQKSYLNEKSR